ALARLCEEMKQQGKYQDLFHAMLLGERLKLGIPAVHVGPSDELSEALQEKYEQAIRVAGRTVGQLCIDAGQIGQAWTFFRLLNEPAPVMAAIEKGQFSAGEQLQEVMQI